MNYPTSLDNSVSLPNPTGTNTQNNPDHAGLHTSENQAIIALEGKVGTGATTPAANTLLVGTGAGTSAWQGLTSAQLAAILTDETGSGSAVFANTPVLITPKVDTINENTVGNGVTVGGVNLKNGVISTASAVSSSAIAAGAVTPDKLLAGAPTSHVWQTWATVWGVISSGANTLGNGSLAASYTQIGKTVHLRILLTWGSTTSSTGVDWCFSPPVTPNTNMIFYPIGNTISSGVSDNLGDLRFFSATQLQPRVGTATGSFVTNGPISNVSPFTWTTGNSLKLSGTYEAA